MRYKVLGVNSGLGVSLYPFKNHLIGNIEVRGIFHSKGNEQWASNFRAPLYKRVATAYSEIRISPNIIISSPDCGSGSILRLSRAKKMGNHKKNASLLLFIETVKKYKPKFFLFENLDGLFKSFPEKEFDQIFSKYFLIKHRVSVADFGNSQKTRKRLVIVGIRRRLGNTQGFWENMFKIPLTLYNPKTCEELYGDLSNYSTLEEALAFGNIRELASETITIYAGKKLKNKEITEIWNTTLKGKKRFTVADRKFTTAPGVYRNLANDYPATARKANRQYDHSGQMLTPRQLARIQGVPDEFKLYTPDEKHNYWINKARTCVTKTPPYEISVWFKARLDRYMNKNNKYRV